MDFGKKEEYVYARDNYDKPMVIISKNTVKYFGPEKSLLVFSLDRYYCLSKCLEAKDENGMSLDIAKQPGLIADLIQKISDYLILKDNLGIDGATKSIISLLNFTLQQENDDVIIISPIAYLNSNSLFLRPCFDNKIRCYTWKINDGTHSLLLIRQRDIILVLDGSFITFNKNLEFSTEKGEMIAGLELFRDTRKKAYYTCDMAGNKIRVIPLNNELIQSRHNGTCYAITTSCAQAIKKIKPKDITEIMKLWNSGEIQRQALKYTRASTAKES